MRLEARMPSGGGLAGSREPMPHRLDERGYAMTRRAGNAEERELQFLRALLQRGGARGVVERVDLVRRDDLRLAGERRVEQRELVADGVQILHRIASARARH